MEKKQNKRVFKVITLPMKDNMNANIIDFINQAVDFKFISIPVYAPIKEIVEDYKPSLPNKNIIIGFIEKFQEGKFTIKYFDNHEKFFTSKPLVIKPVLTYSSTTGSEKIIRFDVMAE